MQMKSCPPEINITLNLQEMQVAKKVILLDIVQAYDESFDTTNVVGGELLESYQQADQAFNYRLCSDPDLLLFCEARLCSPTPGRTVSFVGSYHKSVRQIGGVSSQAGVGHVIEGWC